MADPRFSPEMIKRDYTKLAIIAVVASAVGIAIGLIIHWFPPAASREAKKVDTVWDVLIVCAVPIAVIVLTIVGYCMVRFRQRPGEEDLDGPPTHGNTRLEVIWTAIPAVLMFGLAAYSYVELTSIEKADADGGVKQHIRVVGEQFTWNFFYKNPKTGKEFSTPQLYLKKGERVQFDVQTKDVIHDFWVPNFRMKIDAVPGITTDYKITPTRIGSYPVVCAELCGLGHSTMRQTAHVMTPADYDKWFAKMTTPASAAAPGGASGGSDQAGAQGSATPAPSGGGGGATVDVAAGKAAFESNGCNACHTLSDDNATGTAGPNLDTVLKGKDAAFVKQSIVDPSAEIAKGYQDGIMPKTFKSIPADQLNALVGYLVQVTNK